MHTVLITGGSEGIGWELARCFARSGYRLILAARNVEKLEQAEKMLAGEYHADVTIIPIDLSKRGAAARLAEKAGDVDVLVNNAGMGYTGKCFDQDADESEEMIELNVSAVLILSNIYAEKMYTQKKGIILNVSSTGAFQPGPYINAYYASKSFVLSYTRALHEELKGSGVRVYCLCPGPVRTGFYEKSGSSEPWYAMPPEACAFYAYSHLHQKRCVIVPGFGNKLLRLVPEEIRMKAVGKMKKRKMEKRDAAAG